MRYRRGQCPADVIRAVVAALAQIVAADGGQLVLRSYDPRRRALVLVLFHAPGTPGVVRAMCPVDGSQVADFLTEVLCLHGIELAELRVDTLRAGS